MWICRLSQYITMHFVFRHTFSSVYFILCCVNLPPFAQSVLQFQRAMYELPRGLSVPITADFNHGYLMGSFPFLLDSCIPLQFSFRTLNGLRDQLVPSLKFVEMKIQRVELFQSHITLFTLYISSKNSGGWVLCSVFLHYIVSCMNLLYFILSPLYTANKTKTMK
jgi:hypothetical protein